MRKGGPLADCAVLPGAIETLPEAVLRGAAVPVPVIVLVLVAVVVVVVVTLFVNVVAVPRLIVTPTDKETPTEISGTAYTMT